MVGSDDGPTGPARQVYLTVYVEATAIPNHSPTEFKDALAEWAGQADEPEFTKPVPFSRIFAKGTSFGAPDGEVKDVFYLPLLVQGDRKSVVWRRLRVIHQ
jgi:hypothetical protein